MRFPELHGRPIQIVFLPALTSRQGRLLWGRRDGVEIHAGSFIRERRIVLDRALRRKPRELERIFAHELAHFAWVRLSNAARLSWEDLLAGEKARGELGWSAEWRKRALGPDDRRGRTRRWREYACESFCDSAAWLFAGGAHGEFTLSRRARRARRLWFERSGLTRRLTV